MFLWCDDKTVEDIHSGLLIFEEKNINETGLSWDNFSGRLAKALCQLKPKEKQLLEAWLNYGRDKQVAQALGISPAAAKLRRERLFRRIRKNVTAK